MSPKDLFDPKTAKNLINKIHNLQKRFDQRSNLDLLEEAIKLLSDAIENTSEDDPSRKEFINELDILYIRYPYLQDWLAAPSYDYQSETKRAVSQKDYSDPKVQEKTIEKCRSLQEQFNRKINLDHLEEALQILVKAIENTTDDDRSCEKYIYERNRLYNRYPDINEWLSGPRYDYQVEIKYEYDDNYDEEDEDYYEQLDRTITVKKISQNKISDTYEYHQTYMSKADWNDWVSIFLNAQEYPKWANDEYFSIKNAPPIDREKFYQPIQPNFPENKNIKIIKLTEDVSIEFVKVPAGEFIMGAPEDVWPPRYENAQPQHMVFLDDFWITKTPITRAQYKIFNPNGDYSKNMELPLHYATYYEARYFCAWLREKSGLPIRLPSEAEWEKTAWGTDGRIYPWGDEDPDSYFPNHDRLHSVGRYPFAASPYGVTDICENVCEFVADFYDENYYTDSPQRNPKGPSEGFWHVIRGMEMRTYARESEENKTNPRCGFRCAFSDDPTIPSIVEIEQKESSFHPDFKVIKRENNKEVILSITEDVDMPFMHVPAGEFLMGASDGDKEAEDDQKPQHLVYLDDYWIGKYPVTHEQYAAIRPGHVDFNQKSKNHPVFNVMWTLAEEYCMMLAMLTDLPIRLPTEAEWEKAARGTDGRHYPWGNQEPTPELGNFHDYNECFSSTPVDKYPLGASPYGVMDMGGNLMEWTSDWYDDNYYSMSPHEDPKGPEKGGYKIFRGGAINRVRVGHIFGVKSWFLSEWLQFIGFRCVLEKLT